jgi:hypothetical protein
VFATSITLCAALGGCIDPTPDQQPADNGTGTIEGGVIVDDSTPADTVAIAGSASELLPEMAVEMSRLSGQVGGNEDDDARTTLARINAIWTAIEPEIEETRPELRGGIETTVNLANSAVDRNRPADADKAFSLLTNLVDNFTGDG